MNKDEVRKRLGILHKNSAIPALYPAKYLRLTLETPFVTESTLPLGRETGYSSQYDPALLFAIARAESREVYVSGALPFDGVDIWNAWELTWLGRGSLPAVATLEIRVPADTPNLIESKSLKLYLNSFSMSQFDSPSTVCATIAKDLSSCAGAEVSVNLDIDASIEILDGLCVDNLDISCDTWDVDAALLRCASDDVVEESLHTHLLRSLCPVTDQPDVGSLQLRYAGPRIDPASFLQYVVSFREHNDFHEACVERMFVDILDQCSPTKLSLYARYQRRGGIDINPFRSNFEDTPGNPRLWRQ